MKDKLNFLDKCKTVREITSNFRSFHISVNLLRDINLSIIGNWREIIKKTYKLLCYFDTLRTSLDDRKFRKRLRYRFNKIMRPIVKHHLGYKPYDIVEESEIVDIIEEVIKLPREICCIILEHVID